MNRLLLGALLGCGLLLAGASLAADEPLSLAVASQVSAGNLVYEEMRSGSLRERQLHFHLMLTNTSDAPVRFWEERYSWGYYAVSFRLTDEHGKAWTARKKPSHFTRNIPAFWTLAPGATLAIDVYFADPKLWEGFPPQPAHGTIQAICEVEPDKQSRELHVWTGRLISKEVPFEF